MVAFDGSGDAARARLLAWLAQAAPAEALVVCADSDDRPDLIVVDPVCGLVVVDIDMTAHDPADRRPMSRLNAKVADLRAEVPAVGNFRPQRVVLLGGYPGSLVQPGVTTPPRALGVADAERGDWLNRLEPRKPEMDDLDALRSALTPTLTFTIQSRRGAVDAGKTDRHRQRIELDARQSAAATFPVQDVLVVSGPPGSGKTLVLAGRARHLAAQHPDWHIVMLCFNNSLVPYLRSLVDGYGDITVTTFGKFAHAQGHRISLQRDEQGARDLARARARGINRTVDALLIDEAQDFDDPWLGFAVETVRPGLGGVALAGDDRQALYRDASRPWALADRRVARLQLQRAYRSTRQILAAAGTVYQDCSETAPEGALDGEPVDLIWAQSWDEQAAAAAWEIARLIELGEREPRDIAVLVTQWSGTSRRMQAALEKEGIPFTVVGKANAAEFDPHTPDVKIMTVHGAKGYEFDAIVLFGLEALPSPVGDDEAARRASVGFVGMTRARDQLIVTYTRDNPYLEWLRHCPDVRTWLWPDDYEV
jgi:hypothetical protein